MPKALESFSVVRLAEDIVLQFEDEDGETRELAVTRDQLELIADEIERHFMFDDEEEEEELEPLGDQE